MKQKTAWSALLLRTLLILSVLVFWEWGVQSGRLPSFYISCPSEIAGDLRDFIVSGELWKHTSVTLQEAFIGLLYGSIAGIGAGVLFGQFPFLGQIFKPIITAIHGIPQLTLAPVYILWFGIGMQSKIFLAGLSSFFCVFFSTYGAILDMEPKLIESASLLGAKKSQILYMVVLPTCTPWILSGIRSGFSASLIGAIVGEYMGAGAGFGWMVAYATSYFNMKRVMSCIFILLLLGLVLNFGLDRVEEALLKWRPQTSLNIGEEKESKNN